MKNLRHFCAASMLTLALTLTAVAGQIETGIVPPTAPATPTTQGQIDTGITAGGIEIPLTTEAAAASIAAAALSVLNSVLSLL